MSVKSTTAGKKPATRARRSRAGTNSNPRAGHPSSPFRVWCHEHWQAIAGVLIFTVILSWFWGRLDVAEIHRQAQNVPVAVALVLMVILPLLGCPVSLVNVAIGIRFGIAGGLPLAAAAITLHHIIAFWLVRLKPELFGKLVAPIRRRLPQGSYGSLTVFAALLPGIPYWMQIYSLPLIGVPLRTLLTCAVPFHIARSLIALVGGKISDHITVGWIIGLGVYAVTLMSVCAYAGRRIRHQLQRRSRRSSPVQHSRLSRPRVALAAAGK